MHPFERGSLQQAQLDADPFRGMKISDYTILDGVAERSPCPQCRKSRKYFCYVCFVPVEELKGKIPRLRIPVKIDIIKHRREIDGKSTAAHAAILAPDDVRIFTYPDIPEYSPEEKVVLVYPRKDSKTVKQIFESNSRGDLSDGLPFTRVILIDSTWNQSNGIYKDPRLFSLPTVILHEKISQFWRHQKGSPRWYLATIEAIHQLLVETDVCTLAFRSASITADSSENSSQQLYDGKYDNLLFFFRFMYTKIHTLYDHDKLLSYKRRLL